MLGPRSELTEVDLGSCPALAHTTSNSAEMKTRVWSALLAKTVSHVISLLHDFRNLKYVAEMTPGNGRVLSCSHEICADCLLQLRSAPITHDGQL